MSLLIMLRALFIALALSMNLFNLLQFLFSGI